MKRSEYIESRVVTLCNTLMDDAEKHFKHEECIGIVMMVLLKSLDHFIDPLIIIGDKLNNIIDEAEATKKDKYGKNKKNDDE